MDVATGGDVRLGVLDVGSNTVHLLVVDAHHGAAPRSAYSYKSELRLAEFLRDEEHRGRDLLGEPRAPGEFLQGDALGAISMGVELADLQLQMGGVRWEVEGMATARDSCTR